MIDLVKRLRELALLSCEADVHDQPTCDSECEEAANYIEELEAQVSELEAENAAYEKAIKKISAAFPDTEGER